MAKRGTSRARPATDKTVSKAMTRNAFVALLTRIIASNKVVADERATTRELKDDAVDLHRGALGWMVALKKMTPAKRNEQLFHFHAYCDHLGWPEKGLDLGDREPAPAAPPHDGNGGDEPAASEAAGRPTIIASDDDRDVRPRFLRTGSSAPEAELPKH